MNIVTNVLKKADKLIPVSAVQSILTPVKTAGHEWKPSVIGMAVQAILENGKKELQITTGNEIPTVEEFMQLQEQEKAFNAIFSFGSGDFPEGIQPFVLRAGDDSASVNILAAAIDGDFPEFNKSPNEPFHVLNDFLIPGLSQLMGMTGLDYAELRKNLEHKSFIDQLDQIVGHRGDFIFLLPDGLPVVIPKNNTLSGEFDWGYMSQRCGFTGEVKEEKPKFQLHFGAAKKASAPPVPPPKEKVEAKAVEKPEKKVIASTEPVKQAVVVDESTGKWFTCPIKKEMRNRIKWYESVTGRDFPKNKGIDLNEEKIFIKFSDMENPTQYMTAVNKKTTVKAFSDIPSSVSAKAASVNANKEKLSPVEASAMVMSADERSKATDFILKDVDQSSNVIAGSVEELQQIESKYEKASKQVGFQIEDTYFWKEKKLDELMSQHPKFFKLLFIEMRSRDMSRYKVEDLAKFAPKPPQSEVEQPKAAVDDVPAKPKFTLNFKKAS